MVNTIDLKSVLNLSYWFKSNSRYFFLIISSTNIINQSGENGKHITLRM